MEPSSGTTMRRFLENPTATAASTTTLVLASSRPVHSAQNDDGLLKLGLFRCSGRGVGAANQARTVDAIITLLAPGTICESIGEVLRNARKIIVEKPAEPNRFSYEARFLS